MTTLQSPFYVYLDSSANTVEFESNSTTKFSITLGQALNLPLQENWCVSLSSLSCSNYFSQREERLVKVHLSILQPEFTYDNVLSVLPRPTNKSSTVFYEPRNKEYFPLNQTLISKIEVRLTDLNNRQLSLSYGQPTVLVLEFQKMTGKQEYIVRVDNSQFLETSAQFECLVPPMISFNPNQQWKVSLNSIIYNGTFKQVPPYSGYNAIRFITKEARSQKPIEYRFVLPLKPEFTSNVELWNNMKRVFEKVSDGTFSAFRYVRNLDGKLAFESYQKGTLFIPYSWAVIIGSTRAPLKGTNEVQYNLRAEEPFRFEGRMSYKAWLPNFMLLYADFIEYTAIGHVQAPIMKMIPLFHDDDDTRDYRGYEPKNDEFHKITFSQLQRLRFELRSINGDFIHFEDNDSKIVMSLKFIME